MTKKNFKRIGSSILKEVLDGAASVSGNLEHTQMHKSNNLDLHKTDSAQNCNEDVRLHVYISSEIEDKLLDEVYRRKRDRALLKGQASKRAVVEDALMAFLQ